MRRFTTAAALLATVTLGGCNLLSRGKPDIAAPAAPVAGQHQKFVVSANPLASDHKSERPRGSTDSTVSLVRTA